MKDDFSIFEFSQKFVLLVEKSENVADLSLKKINFIRQLLFVALARLSKRLNHLCDARSVVVRTVGPRAGSFQSVDLLLAVTTFDDGHGLEGVDPLQRSLFVAGMIRLRLLVLFL